MSEARHSLAAFSAEIGRPLSDAQSRALSLETRTTCILAPRQSGKSRSLALLALWWAFRRREQAVLIVSAGEDASRRLLSEIRRTATGSPLLRGSVVDEQAALLTLTNGSSIRSVPASERAIRGYSVDLLLIDEAALVSDDVALGAALPTTAARPDARVVLASSPWAEGGFFHSHVSAGDSDYVRVHRWTLEDAPWISSAVVEAARASMPAARFAAEYEARWSSSIDALFSRRLLERCAADVDLPALEDLKGPARLLGGIDWGVTTDRSALAAIARLPVGKLNPNRDPTVPVFLVAASRAWPAGEPLSRVVASIARAPTHWAIFSSETNGVGAGPTQELFRYLLGQPVAKGGGRRRGAMLIEETPSLSREPEFTRAAVRSRPEWHTIRNAVATSAQSKALVYERLRWLCDRGQLVLPRDGDLLRELAALRIELRPGGTMGLGAGVGHDDLADALYLAAGPYRHQGQLRCYLDRVAAHRLPEADVPDTGEPVVQTGGGLSVWRRPPLQSISRTDLTLPDPWPSARPPALLAAREAVREAVHPQQKEALSG